MYFSQESFKSNSLFGDFESQVKYNEARLGTEKFDLIKFLDKCQSMHKLIF